MHNVVIVAAKRTAIGNFLGSLANIPAVELGATVIRALLAETGVKPDMISEVIMGNVLTAGLGQNPARQAAMSAGIDKSVPAMTINQVCGSGLKATHLAIQAIMCGDAEIVIAGGQENMSLSPHLLPNSRAGFKMGDTTLVDSMLKDGLTDVYNQYHMGITAEIVPVLVPQRKGEPISFATDEFIKADVTLESLTKLRPAFRKDGTVTAGSSSGINDGAAAVMLMTEVKAKELGLQPLAYIKAYASVALEPEIMGVGPIYASKKTLSKAGWNVADLDLIEANEAFAAQAIAVNNEMKWDTSKVNVNGGAIALGHPIGGSGCRILVTLLHEMQRRDAKKGLATLCIGGGMGVALAIERR